MGDTVSQPRFITIVCSDKMVTTNETTPPFTSIYDILKKQIDSSRNVDELKKMVSDIRMMLSNRQGSEKIEQKERVEEKISLEITDYEKESGILPPKKRVTAEDRDAQRATCGNGGIRNSVKLPDVEDFKEEDFSRKVRKGVPLDTSSDGKKGGGKKGGSKKGGGKKAKKGGDKRRGEVAVYVDEKDKNSRSNMLKLIEVIRFVEREIDHYDERVNKRWKPVRCTWSEFVNWLEYSNVERKQRILRIIAKSGKFSPKDGQRGMKGKLIKILPKAKRQKSQRKSLSFLMYFLLGLFLLSSARIPWYKFLGVLCLMVFGSMKMTLNCGNSFTGNMSNDCFFVRIQHVEELGVILYFIMVITKNHLICIFAPDTSHLLLCIVLINCRCIKTN